jgi:hypothetical protein
MLEGFAEIDCGAAVTDTRDHMQSRHIPKGFFAWRPGKQLGDLTPLAATVYTVGHRH